MPHTSTILGADTHLELNKVRYMNTVCSSESDIFCEIQNAEFFESLGCFPGKYSIKTEFSLISNIHPPCKIPFLMKDKVYEELQKMNQFGVIKPDPTVWVNTMKTVNRICLDPMDLNNAIQRAQFY